MGTYHSFISKPFRSELDALELKNDIERIIENSSYRNSIDNFQTLMINSFYIVVGIYKNLSGAPLELSLISYCYDWATVSDENDFFNSEK